MRLIDPDPRVDARHRRLLWQVLQRLGKFRDPSTSKSRQSVQSHVAPAVARLLGRGSTPDHQRAKQDLVDQLGSRRKLHANLLQSAALGLGQLLLPGEDLPADAESGKALWRHYDTTRDQQTRHFILIAAGQIGGETNFERVAREFRTGKREIQAWAALSLGLMAFHAPKVKPQAGAQGPVKDVRAMTGLLLHGGLLRINNRDVRAAIALGLGLCGHKAAAADMRRLLEKYRRVEEFAGYLCMGLALMDDKAAGAQIQAVMGDSSRRPLLMSQAALALGRLRHPGASTTLRALLQTGGVFGTLTLASTATAMGYLADPKNVAPLIRILGDTGHNSLVRAFAAVALGSMAENDPLTWSAWVAMNMNYSAAAETLSNGSSGILDIL
ncbi:MAG: hypothetical protein KDC87_04090, partial [Planctomycetes bacterium]|nr:hypothetical protein [Planctomycetota bacterium]